MIIQDVINQVTQSSGSIFTREDVISILQSLELEEQGTLEVPKKGKKGKKERFGTIRKGLAIIINESQMEQLAEEIAEHVGNRIRGIDAEAAFDECTAEFDLNGNEISLVSVELNHSVIYDEATGGITDVIEEFMRRLAKRG